MGKGARRRRCKMLAEQRDNGAKEEEEKAGEPRSRRGKALGTKKKEKKKRVKVDEPQWVRC